MTSPVFMTGEQVTLRPLEEADLEFCQAAINHPDVRNSLMLTGPVSMAEEEDWFEAGDDEVRFAIWVDDERVGTLGLSDVNETWGTAEVGYWVHPESWGNGYCTDAVRCVCRYAFDERRFAKLVARAYETNPGSQRVLEKAGFEREGVFRQEAYVEGEHVDVYRYGLLADEWRGD